MSSDESAQPEHLLGTSAGGAVSGLADAAQEAFLVPDTLVLVNSATDVVAPKLTVVIPTRNERHNIEDLLARLGRPSLR